MIYHGCISSSIVFFFGNFVTNVSKMYLKWRKTVYARSWEIFLEWAITVYSPEAHKHKHDTHVNRQQRAMEPPTSMTHTHTHKHREHETGIFEYFTVDVLFLKTVAPFSRGVRLSAAYYFRRTRRYL